MVIKFLDLNILKGFRLNQVINFIKEQNFDIVNLQEVTGGKFSDQNNLNCFNIIKNNLPDYQSEQAISLSLKNDKNSYFGNATFFKKTFPLIKKEIIHLRQFQELDYPLQIRFEEYAKCALSLNIKINNNEIYFINTHQAWSPSSIDTEEKLYQGKILLQYINTLKYPFVLSGDFNVDSRSQIIKNLNKISYNVTEKNNVTNTLNPRIHSAKELFPPGLAVDFIFVSPIIKIQQFKLIDNIDLSDHFGQSIEFNLL